MPYKYKHSFTKPQLVKITQSLPFLLLNPIGLTYSITALSFTKPHWSKLNERDFGDGT
jgi:hypothetical protein